MAECASGEAIIPRARALTGKSLERRSCSVGLSQCFARVGNGATERTESGGRRRDKPERHSGISGCRAAESQVSLSADLVASVSRIIMTRCIWSRKYWGPLKGF